MQQPDDLELRKEIEAISDRIDRILKKIEKHYLTAGSDQQKSNKEPVSTETICHLNKTPDQEA
jgi:hypothetical protein